MNVLALEPYHGGSHEAFLDGWSAHSRHTWSVLGLEAFKWKWRMRHAAITLAGWAADRAARGQTWDVVFCSDMLNLAEFRGLAPEPVRRLPAVAYFHENQLTYPVRQESERDYHFVVSNLITAIAASEIWSNSAFNRDLFLGELPGFLRRMPDHQPLDAVEAIHARSRVHPPGIERFAPRGPRRPGPMRILWAARWEHDKDPDAFFGTLELLRARGVDFRLSVIGQTFRYVLPAFEQARQQFGDRIDRWGYQEGRGEYVAALTEADVIVSTARHEFFGLSVVEAVAAGAYPVVPRRLAYPEVLEGPDTEGFFYEGGAQALADRLAELADRQKDGDLWDGDPDRGVRRVDRFCWDRLAPGMDDALESVVG